MQEELKKDLETLEKEIEELRQQLINVNTQRDTLIAKIQQLNGAAAYLRGKLGINTPVEEVEEKPEETTEENSEG
jgi:septal ring factor EnvC (AmiA/AmiB activator)